MRLDRKEQLVCIHLNMNKVGVLKKLRRAANLSLKN